MNMKLMMILFNHHHAVLKVREPDWTDPKMYEQNKVKHVFISTSFIVIAL